MVHAESKQMMD